MTDIPDDKSAPANVAEPIKLHQESIEELALVIANLLDAVLKEENRELFLNQAATEPIIAALIDGFREVMQASMSQGKTIQISKVTLMESVRIGPHETSHIAVETPSFKNRKLEMEWAEGSLLIRWDSHVDDGAGGKTLRKNRLIVFPGNIRHMTPIEETLDEKAEKAIEGAA